MRTVSDKGIRAFYTAGTSFDNLTSAMAMQSYNILYYNKSFDILSDDYGWYERVHDAIANQEVGYEDLTDFNCFFLLLIGGIIGAILSIATGMTGNIAIKCLSISCSTAVSKSSNILEWDYRIN